MTYLGSRLKYLRKSENITQQHLATALGIAKSTVSMYENGQREPDFETLEAISDYFNVDMRTFFPSGEKPITEAAVELAPGEDRLLSLYRELNEEGREKLVDYADDMVRSGKYKKNNPICLANGQTN